ncbi:MAG: ArsR/SmtB family transcription factor [Candidatus Hydrothermia bacterium]
MRIYADKLKVLGELKRLKLYVLLAKSGGNYYVCELADALEEPHYSVSRSLNELKKAGLVEEQKMGKGVMYFVNQRNDPVIRSFLNFALSVPDELISRERDLLLKRATFRDKSNFCIFKLKEEWKGEGLQDNE